MSLQPDNSLKVIVQLDSCVLISGPILKLKCSYFNFKTNSVPKNQYIFHFFKIRTINGNKMNVISSYNSLKTFHKDISYTKKTEI